MPPAVTEAVRYWTERLRRESPTQADDAPFPPTAEVLGRAYEFVQPARLRKRRGTFFTPPLLTGLLVGHALRPLLVRRLKAAAGRADDVPVAEWTPDQRRRGTTALLKFRVLDPACGTGNLLAAAGRELTAHLVALRHSGRVTDAMALTAAAAVRRYCLHGCDRDETAVRLARLASAYAAGPGRLQDPCGVRAADFLRQPPAGPFDVALGNPPFAGVVAAGLSPERRTALGERFPEIAGTADLSSYFLAAAERLLAPDGTLGMVLPRTFLNDDACRPLRERLAVRRPPSLLVAPAAAGLFADASVQVAAVVLDPHAAVCVGTRSPDGGRLEPVRIDGPNWWAPLLGEVPETPAAAHTHAPPRTHAAAGTVGEVFEVVAGMTAGMAYDLRPFLVDADDPGDLRPRLLTTGLIGAGRSRWGERTCRYLKADYGRPVIDLRPDMPAALRRRVETMDRPKLLVAGLSQGLRALLDADGRCRGAVSTFAVLHPADDLDALRRLGDLLHDAATGLRLQRDLGARALSSGRITLTKRFLRDLPFEPACENP